MASVEDVPPIEAPSTDAERIEFLERRLALTIKEQRLMFDLLRGLGEAQGLELTRHQMAPGEILFRWKLRESGRIILPS